MELLYKVKTELPYDATGHLLSLLTKTTRIGKTEAGKGALQQYCNSQDIEAKKGPQHTNGQRRSCIMIEWNIGHEKK